MKDLSAAKSFQINKKTNEILFSNLSKLDSNIINEITNVLHYSLTDSIQKNSNTVTLFGPKLDPTKFIKFKLLNLPNQQIYETSYNCPNLNRNVSKVYNGLIIQVFHSTFIFEKEDLDYLKMIYSRNQNYIEFNSPQDFLYFLKIKIDNKQNQIVYEARSGYIEVTKYENGVIYLEWNSQYLFNYDILKYYNLKVNTYL